MKTVRLSVIILLLIFILVNSNAIFIRKATDGLIGSLSELDGENTIEEYEVIYKRYQKNERLMSLTIGHDELCQVSDCFTELLTAIRNKNTDDAIIAKSRLIGYLEHIRRLSGINLYSIF